MAYPWRGVWSANTIYPSGSLVSFEGAIFLATSTTTVGQSPPAAPWSVVVAQEGQGPSAGTATVPAYTVAQMRAQSAGWFLAHRGSGAEFPEHTMVGYDASMELLRTNGFVPAMEVSCVAAADKTLFCMHDPDFDKSTTSTGAAVNRPWSEISALITSSEADYLGPGWPGQKLVTLREVLDRFIHNTVIFVEAKTNQAVQPLQRMLLEDYPQARQNIVVKMAYNNSLLSWARTNGFTTWGYLAGDGLTSDAELNAYDSVVDMWGVPTITTDARVAQIVARGKDVIMWEIHRRAQVTQLVALGVKGLMCSRIAYVTRSTNTEFTYKMLAADNFDSKVMMPGMLENDATIPASEAARANRLKFDASDGSVYFPSLSSAHTVCLGGLNEVPAPSSYNVLWSMKWPVLPPVSTQVSGVAVCRPDDTAYVFTASTNTVGGYHCLIRQNGELVMNRHDPGTGTSTTVANGTPPTTGGFQPPVADTYMTFRIEVRPTSLTFVRTDITPEFSITSSAAVAQTYRGPYMHLVSGNVTQDSSTPHWRDVSMPTI